MLSFSADKQRYNVGDHAILSIPSSKGRALISIENGSRVIQAFWAETKAPETTIDFKITPEGRSLGITANHLGRQVRYSYYGAEALRQQRGRNEVKVMVRLPEKERRSMHRLEELIIQTPAGGEIPLAQAAHIRFNEAPTDIKRVDGKRVLTITANVIPELVNANKRSFRD